MTLHQISYICKTTHNSKLCSRYDICNITHNSQLCHDNILYICNTTHINISYDTAPDISHTTHNSQLCCDSAPDTQCLQYNTHKTVICFTKLLHMANTWQTTHTHTHTHTYKSFSPPCQPPISLTHFWFMCSSSHIFSCC